VADLSSLLQEFQMLSRCVHTNPSIWLEYTEDRDQGDGLQEIGSIALIVSHSTGVSTLSTGVKVWWVEVNSVHLWFIHMS